MRSKIKRITAMILAVVMVLIAAPVMPGSNTVYADTTANIPYDGNDVNAIKADGSGYGMFTPQEGTTCMLDGDNVLLHYVPKNTTTYKGFIWGEISDVPNATDETVQPGVDVELKNGAFDVTLPKSYCGTARAFAPIKNAFGKGSWTSADQYYLAIPAADKLPVKPHDPLDVYVTITNAGAVAVANESINVKDADSDGKITLDDVFVAAHDEWFEGGAAEGYAKEYNDYYQSYGITKFWGVSNGGSYLYYVNNAMAWGLSDTVVEGDHVVAGVMKDAAGYSDKYTYFDAFDYEADGTLTVTLTSATGEYDANWNPVYGPCTNANITLVSVTRAPEDGSYNVINNGDGTYSLTFHNRGDYKLIASNDAIPLIPAVADLRVNNVASTGYKFKARISSQTEANGVGSVTGTVYDNFDADLQFNGTHVNRSNFTLEMWMRNVASLGVDAERYYSRSVETGATGEDSAMSTIKALFNGFDSESKIVAKVDGDKTVTYTVKNGDGMVKATPDSFNNAHDTWYAIVDEENMTVTHSEGEDDSYIVIAKGSWLQAGDKKLEFQSDEDLRIDDIGDIAGVRQAIRDALALNDAEAVETLEIYLEPGTTLAVSSSKVVLEKDAKITVDFGNFDESGLAADLEKLQQAGDVEQLIKDSLKFVEKIVDAMGGETTNVTIDFGHVYPEPGEDEENPVWTWADDYSSATATFLCLNNEEHTVEVEAVITSEADGVRGTKYTATATLDGKEYTDEKLDEDYKFKIRVASETETNGVGSVTGRVFRDYSAEIVFEGTHVNRSNALVDMWMRNVASLDVDEERHYSRAIETGLTGEDTAMSVVKAPFAPFDTESKIVALVDGETTTTYTVKNDENGNVQATPDSFENAHDTWYAIVNEENMKVTHSDSAEDSFMVIAKGSWLQIGDQRLDVESELKLDDLGDLDAMRTAIKNAVKLNTADEAVETIEYYLEPETILAVGSSKVELLKDAKFTVDVDGYDESTLSTDLDALQNAGSMDALIKEALKVFEKVTQAMGGKTTTVTIDFGHIYPAPDEQDEENPNPVWEWADDYSSATATFTCLNNDEHVETYTMTTDPAVTITVDDTDPSKTVYTASVTVDGVTYTDVKEENKDIVVLPYPGTAPHDDTTRFTENTDDKDITNDALYTYTIRGHLVTVSCDRACKIGYLNAAGDQYITVKNIEKVSDTQYTFTVPDDIFEVILVIKGDDDLDGEINNFDTTLSKAFDLYYNETLASGYDLINLFAADVDDDDEITNFDTVLIKAADLYPNDKQIEWVYN